MTALLVFLVLVIVVEFILLLYGERGWRDALNGWTRALDAWKETNQEWHDHCVKQNREWGEYCSNQIESYGARCIGLGRKVDDLNEQLAAQAYVIGALKTQVRDSQQAGMTLQIAAQDPPYQEYERLTAELQSYMWEVEARKANGDSWRGALDKIMTAAGVEWWEGEPPADKAIAHIERLTSENAKLRRLLDWALRPGSPRRADGGICPGGEGDGRLREQYPVLGADR
jgi:hypothetical protein